MLTVTPTYNAEADRLHLRVEGVGVVTLTNVTAHDAAVQTVRAVVSGEPMWPSPALMGCAVIQALWAQVDDFSQLGDVRPFEVEPFYKG